MWPFKRKSTIERMSVQELETSIREYNKEIAKTIIIHVEARTRMHEELYHGKENVDTLVEKSAGKLVDLISGMG